MDHKVKHRIWLVAAKLLDYILVSFPFWLCWYLYYKNAIVNPFYGMGNIVVCLYYLIMFCIICRVYDADQISLHRISEMYYSQVLSFGSTSYINGISEPILPRRPSLSMTTGKG